MAGRGTDRSTCHVTARRAPDLAHSAGTVQRRLRRQKGQPAQVIYRQVAQEAGLRLDKSTDTRRLRLHQCHPPNTCAGRHSAHVLVHRGTQTFITRVHTSLLFNAFMYARTQFSHTHSPHSHLECIQTSITYIYIHKHTLSPANTLHPHPLHPTLTPWLPHEPAPALLSTRDWPTRIRILDARMDRQKLSKMMERSDFINLRGHSRQRQRSWLPRPTWGD